ncbi:hypothetical protein COLO4_25986 [Corchorus olitorius]|uniref:Uncharacterized protein n=1 Tax=Corchorus olitorius TaxID=93759 RepID=A0A1R3HZE0_9ROSI|nr:hypothetical protein COLO4_25986 [Corchorus olitorius]
MAFSNQIFERIGVLRETLAKLRIELRDAEGRERGMEDAVRRLYSSSDDQDHLGPCFIISIPLDSWVGTLASARVETANRELHDLRVELTEAQEIVVETTDELKELPALYK